MRSGAAAGPTILGPGCRFVGELSGDEDIVVSGRLEGTIRVDRRVTVGPEGRVEGEIHGRQVIVGGHVRGDVHGSERVELTSSAVVEGGVHAPKILIAEGARLEGQVAMSDGTGTGKGKTDGKNKGSEE